MDHKLLYRDLESVLGQAGAARTPRRFAERLLAPLVQRLGAGAGLVAVELYARDGGGLSRLARAGQDLPDLSRDAGQAVAPAEGATDGPWAGLAPGGTVGMFTLPESADCLVALRFAEGVTPRHALEIASPLQYALSQHLRRRDLENLIEQAHAIQVALLPTSPPAFGDFDIAARSLPAHIVGGDLYDFIPLDRDTLALAIADASGHGLPAALQARDVATGLRMGVERDLKVPRILERLNRVIHRSGLASRFVSLVFGELETNGTLAYVNAGHPPPLLLDDGGVHELSVGGMILGPDPTTRYKLGFAHLDRGASLFLYTDGVVERGTTGDGAFGHEGLVEWLTEWRDGPAPEALDDLVERLRRHGSEAPFDDDVTAVLIRRPR